MNERIIANIKALGIDMIGEAKSGHPGIVLSAAPILYTLFLNHLNINTSDSNWENRDRFVMSAGHGSALLYAVLYMAGFPISIEDLKKFRKAGSLTPGHPEYGVTPGVDASTGPLGQGIAMAVGMAIAEKISSQNTKLKGHSLIDHNIYVLVGDGDLMEGISYEATSLAGSLNLDNLIVLYDSNQVSLDGKTKSVFDESIKKRFKAINWDYEFVKNGENVKSINLAIERAKRNKKPTLIEIRTILGRGSILEGSHIVHGKPLDKEDITQLKYNLKIQNTPFYVDEEAKNYFCTQIAKRSNAKYQRWADDYREFLNTYENSDKLSYIFGQKQSYNFLNYSFTSPIEKEATRVTNKKIMNEIAPYIINMVGGSADLASATNAYINDGGDITKENFSSKNIHFGVREHAMGAILNGMALSNMKPFGSTFLAFSDYVKPAIRMSALMKLPVTYIFSHDSFLVGQDGPTHQPIEQISALRNIPNLKVYRPCDRNELIGVWNEIVNTYHNPSVLLLSRTEVEQFENTSSKDVAMGAYILRKEQEKLDGIIIATGTEVQVAYHLANILFQENHMDLRVVSMPCMENFLSQTMEYQKQIIPKETKTFVLEASSSSDWYRFTQKDYLFTVDKFGISGSKEEVIDYFEYNFEKLKNKILLLMGNK